jgi:Arc/MetJ-type ribon-helix-helix transcriptional regulator
MSIIHVQLPDELRSAIERQIAEGKVVSETEFFVEAARRFVADLAVEDEVVAEANAGIADAESGRFEIIASPKDVDHLHQRTVARLRDRLASDRS